jgi:tripartite-type tricarboxylate transporter receptor subunit TctC
MRQFLLAAAIVALLSSAGQAQPAFPGRPIRLITITTPGGSLDILARTIAQHLSEQISQPVVVETRLGAGGNIGVDLVAKSAPDGYTIGMATVSTHGINPSLFGASMPFDAIKDFAPISLAAELKNVVVVNPSVPANNMQELVTYARANPGKLSFGSAGTGTSQHLSGELLKMVAKVDMVHVPYKGAASAAIDLVAGRIQLMFSSIPDVLPNIRASKLRAIGVTSLQRSSVLPEQVPVSEQGFSGFDVRAWFGVVAPAATPRDIVNRLNREIVTLLAKPEVRERLGSMGMDVNTSTPEQFAAFIVAEVAKWAPVVKASGAKVD